MREIGTSLIAEAENKITAQLQDKARDEVATVLESIRSAEQQIQHASETKHFYERRLQAINAGKFELDNYTGKVTYKEKELNERR